MKKLSYHSWPNCIKLTNGNIELIATTDIGPRIIRLGFCDQQNFFKEYPDQSGATGGDGQPEDGACRGARADGDLDAGGSGEVHGAAGREEGVGLVEGVRDHVEGGGRVHADAGDEEREAHVGDAGVAEAARE